MKIIFLSIFTLISVNVKAEKPENQIFELIYSKNILSAKKLILNKPEILSIKGKFGQTPLIAATNLNRKELIELIIKNSKTINEQDLGGATALHIAARNGNTEIVKLLIDNGANLNIHDNQDYTPLTRALEFQRHDIVELIRQKSKTKAS